MGQRFGSAQMGKFCKANINSSNKCAIVVVQKATHSKLDLLFKMHINEKLIVYDLH